MRPTHKQCIETVAILRFERFPKSRAKAVRESRDHDIRTRILPPSLAQITTSANVFVCDTYVQLTPAPVSPWPLSACASDTFPRGLHGSGSLYICFGPGPISPSHTHVYIFFFFFLLSIKNMPCYNLCALNKTVMTTIIR